VDSAVDSAVGSAVGSAVDSAMDSAVYSAVEWHFWFGGAFWSTWPAFESFFREVCELRLDGDFSERAAAYATCSRTAGYWWPNKRFIIASERPAEIHLQDGRLHNPAGPAVLYRDGWGISAWRGVVVPDHWIAKRETLDPAEVLACKNVEQRAVGMEIVGWPKALEVLDAKIVDSDEDPDHGDIIDLILPGIPEPGRFLRAYCPRNNLIVEGVPLISDIDGKPINTVKAAQAWSWGYAEADFEYPTNVS